ncbi:unnamed protein product, partial [Allacma fusca]
MIGTGGGCRLGIDDGPDASVVGSSDGLGLSPST